MQVTVEVAPGLERRLKVSVPAQQIDQEVDQRLKNLIQKVKIDGFRPGKAPLPVIKQRYENAVRYDVIEEKVKSSYVEALRQEALFPAGDPRIEIVSAEAGKPLEYTATIEVYPKIELKELKGVEIEEFDAKVTDQDVNEGLEKLQKQNSQWVEVDRAAQKGDKVAVDFVGKIDGEAFDGGTGKNIKIELGSNMMIPGFEEGLVGAKAGDERELKLKFPENYHHAKYAGVEAVFSVTVNQVLEPKLPALDDQFAEQLGLKEGGIEELKTKLKTNMEEELKKSIKNLVKQKVLDEYLEANPVELPKALVEIEMDRMLREAEQELARYGRKNIEDFPRENFREMAEIRVSLGLLFAEYIKVHDLKADPEKVKDYVQRLAASYPQPEQVISWYYSNRKNLAQIETLILEDQVIDQLLQHVTVKKKAASYQDVINYQPKEEE
jgi:trigger factor